MKPFLEFLDFYFSPNDDMLEAKIADGFYVIWSSWPKGNHLVKDDPAFVVTGFISGKRIEEMRCKSIYEALEKANKHYESL